MTEQEQPYTVIVGVSATSKSPTALVWARAQAEANHGRLIVVRTYKVPNAPQGHPGTMTRNAPEREGLQARQQATLEADVAEVLGEGHGAEVRAVQGGKRRGLLDQAHEADLLVIDAPRSPSTAPLLAQRIIYAAACPVVVMPPSIAGAPEPALTRSARNVGRAALRSAATSGRPGYRTPPTPTD